MIPISDDNPRHGKIPFITVSLIVMCVVVFLYQLGIPPEFQKAFVYFYGAVPADIFSGDGGKTDNGFATSGAMGLFTSMFLHGGIMHLLGNMVYLWIFGDNVEIAMGRVRFVIFYILTGLVAALTHAYFDPTSQIPMVGASGAISGLLGAYLMLYPKANVKMLFIFGLFWRMIYVPAFVVLTLWFLIQFVGVAGKQEGGGVAFLAHIGGFVAGMLLVKLFIRKDEYLFHKPTHRPWETQKATAQTIRKRPWDQ